MKLKKTKMVLASAVLAATALVLGNSTGRIQAATVASATSEAAVQPVENGCWPAAAGALARGVYVSRGAWGPYARHVVAVSGVTHIATHALHHLFGVLAHPWEEDSPPDALD
jgi:hypothetical protein